MIYFIGTIILFAVMNTRVIFDFNNNTDISGWKVVDDVVMGGRSSGQFTLTPDGHGFFNGHVSLENNGGFSLVRYRFKRLEVNENHKIIIRLKGDGKRYQFRIKDKSANYYSYIYYFNTTGEWQEIEVPLEEMSPFFRGRKLEMPNFSGDRIEEIAFLIGNKKAEDFSLLLDWVKLR